MLRLVVTADGITRHYPLRGDTLRIGSAEDNDVVVHARGVSRHHALLETRDHGIAVTDLHSRNGLVLAGTRVHEAAVMPGTVVHLGTASIQLEEVSTSDADIALRLAMSSSSGIAADEQSDTGSVPAVGADRGAIAALRWARAADAGALGRQALIDEAREVLGADSLVFFSRDRDDIALLELSGDASGQQFAQLAEITQSLKPEQCPAAAGRWIIVRGNGDVWGAAHLSHGTAASAWRREFADYVCAHLFSGAPAGSPPAGIGGSALTLPPEVVIGSSAVARRLFEQVQQIARGRVDVLVTGETGTGKEVVAQALHANGPTARGPFIAVNCAALAADILEAELFGIERAVATGVGPRPGIFVEANGGTIFLDEISEMAEKLQAKLLRVLQQREVMPVGSAKTRHVDVRVISSTNRDLQQLVHEGRFRKDLYFRIRGSEIHVPALRDRREDIPALIFSFTSRAAHRAHKKIAGVSRKALSALIAHDWPGNVRELEHTIEHAVLVCPNGTAIQHEHLELQFPAGSPASHPHPPSPSPSHVSSRSSAGTLRDAERDAIAKALANSAGNKTRAAKLLGITRAALYLKLRRFGLG